jgi:hypothetical protein
MSRAGVRPDIAERVMGHAITGVAPVQRGKGPCSAGSGSSY